ncbi:Glycine--tRNA ligase beta subunit [Serratia fonticola]|uniref:Glycine--tRNA ligase beta subunit n=1 Tax=Serratia fonticola TaxID=47917 RepID=A0A4U9WH83_SERFO|nr:Glycine--tRNA ligase beta subunit [Serratia fonticola]
MVEWPVVLTAKFEEKFLGGASEALVYTMKAIRSISRCMTPRANCCELYLRRHIESKDPQQSSPVTRRWCARVCRCRILLQYRPQATPGRQPAASGNRAVPTATGHPARQDRPYPGHGGWIAGQIGADVKPRYACGATVEVRSDDQHGVRIHRHPRCHGMHYARHDGEAEDVAVALNETVPTTFCR